MGQNLANWLPIGFYKVFSLVRREVYLNHSDNSSSGGSLIEWALFEFDKSNIPHLLSFVSFLLERSHLNILVLMSNWTNLLYKAIRLVYKATLASAFFSRQFILAELKNYNQ